MRHEFLNEKSLHSDVFTSLRLYSNENRMSKEFVNVNQLYKGDIHQLSCESEFGFSVFNETSALLSIKLAKSSNDGFLWDVIENVAQKLTDPFTEIIEDMITGKFTHRFCDSMFDLTNSPFRSSCL